LATDTMIYGMLSALQSVN